MGSRYDKIMKILADGNWHKDIENKMSVYFTTSKLLERKAVFNLETRRNHMVYRRTDVRTKVQ